MKKQSRITNTPKEITSTEALEKTPGLIPQITPTNNGMRAPEQTTEPLIINNIVMRSVDRTPKDIGSWRTDHKMAESIYYPQRSRLYDLYKDVELDAHLSGIWKRRVSAATNKKIRFTDADGTPNDTINDLIKSLEFRNMLKEIMNTIMWGITGFEFLPGEKFSYKLIPRKHIKPEKKVIAINQTDYVGIPYEDISNLWVIGEDRDLGLLLKAAFYVLLKKGDFADWANYIEIFGQPVMVTKYDSYDEKTKVQLSQMMEEAGASLKLSIPKQADFDILDGKQSNGNGDLQDKFKNACNDELSVLILTVTETTKSSSSSGFAQSKTQSEEQFEITQDDVFMLMALLNSDKFMNILRSYNLPVDGGKFIIEENMKLADQVLFAQVLDTVKNKLKTPVSDDFVYETFGIPKPDDYDEQKEKQQVAAAVVVDDPTDDPVDDPADDPKTKKPAPKKPIDKNKIKKPASVKLSSWDRFMATMANFFDQAHKG